MEEQGVEFMQFAFRWMNCLLMREISVKCTIRMWDTYLAEGTDAFSQFHLYVCSAFLVKWSEKLQKMDFQVCQPSFCYSRRPRKSSIKAEKAVLTGQLGNHHVPPTATDGILDRP